MSFPDKSVASWIRLAGISGSASVLCYFGAAFLPVPDVIGRLLAFAFGPLLCFAFLGMYHYLAGHRNGPLLQVACLSGIIAGVLLTLMLVIQVGNNMVRDDMLTAANSVISGDVGQLAWRAVDRVQLLVDVVMDIFICLATILIGCALWSHPRFGKLWGGVGIIAGALLLVLNLQAFPTPPASSNSVDVGPLVALWMLAMFVRMLLLLRLPKQQSAAG